MKPSVNFQGALPPSGVCQAPKFVPSSRITASLGAGVAALSLAGSTTGGLGRWMSCCNQRYWVTMLRTSSAARKAKSPNVGTRQKHASRKNLAGMGVDLLEGNRAYKNGHRMPSPL